MFSYITFQSLLKDIAKVVAYFPVFNPQEKKIRNFIVKEYKRCPLWGKNYIALDSERSVENTLKQIFLIYLSEGGFIRMSLKYIITREKTLQLITK